MCDSPAPIGAPLVSLAKSEVIGLAVRTDKQGIIIVGLANLKLLCFDAGVELTRSEAAETIPHFLGNWPYGGANASEFRLSDLRTLEEWRDVAGLLPTSQSSLLVADGLLYFGDNSQEFYCVDSERRGLVWSQQLRAPVIFAPALDAARVYATVVSLELEVEAKTVLWTERHWYAQGRSILYAFDRRTGEVRWTHTTGFRTTPLVQEGRVYFGGLTGYGVLEAETGKSVWIQDSPLSRKELPFWYVLGKPTRDTLPVLAVRLRQRMDPKWILRAEGDTKVLFVEAATGKTQKEIPLPRVPMSDHPFAASAVFSPTLDRVTVAVGNAVRAYRLPEGTLLWERPLAGSVVPGAVLQENRWFLPLDAPGVACINLETGQQEWAFQQMTGAPGALTLQDGTLLFGALDSNLYACRRPPRANSPGSSNAPEAASAVPRPYSEISSTLPPPTEDCTRWPGAHRFPKRRACSRRTPAPPPFLRVHPWLPKWHRRPACASPGASRLASPFWLLPFAFPQVPRALPPFFLNFDF